MKKQWKNSRKRNLYDPFDFAQGHSEEFESMINIKTNEEIEKMREGGKILADVLFKVLEHAKVGVSELELDKLTEELILKAGAEPGFKKVANYHHTICVSTNNVVVHGVPTNYKFKDGDVVGIDCGVYFNHEDIMKQLGYKYLSVVDQKRVADKKLDYK